MRPNVKQFVQLLAETGVFPAPVIDIGSLRTEGQEDYADLRPYFVPAAYTGFDMRKGTGVDCVGTIHRLPLATASVGTVILLDTLEHVLEPLAAMEEVARVLLPGGVVVMSSHMNFPIHAHPSDYWRFTPMMFDHLMRAFPSRYVLVQGNVENPHTVLGIGCKGADAATGAAFRGAVRGVRDAWPDATFGGCLFGGDPLLLDIEQRAPDRDLPALKQGRVISQTFVCRENGLARVDILMAQPAGESLRQLLFVVRDVDAGKDVAALHVAALQIVDSEWLSVEIAPQDASAGRVYEVIVTSPDGGAEDGVSMKASDAAVHVGGRLMVDGEIARGSMCIKTFFRPPAGAGLDPWSQPGGGGVARDVDPEEAAWHQRRMNSALATAAADKAEAELRAQRATHHAAKTEPESAPARVWARLRGKGNASK